MLIGLKDLRTLHSCIVDVRTFGWPLIGETLSETIGITIQHSCLLTMLHPLFAPGEALYR